ncbi:hypothetical protein [Roseimicrobium sp. ORNL1]|uniref:hypothetical protein n=1 Tax=Roseimicrobium sp. ORNL1 TaxID=2711231 RepID=UPI0013E1D4EB|nr:hypothetical protein [Roseimicrobium sp. ORNL1]QIF02803.1 hypothetical protein G5S37_15155 [Roseimicrobium sp. ORNL1]
MNDDSAPASPTPPRPRRRLGFHFALVGLIIGFLGLGIAAYQMYEESETQPTRRVEKLGDLVADTIKEMKAKLASKKEGKPQAKEERAAARKMGLAASACGFLGVVLGCLSWLKGERYRWTLASLAVGIAALAWTYVVVAAAVAAAALVVLMILGSF